MVSALRTCASCFKAIPDSWRRVSPSALRTCASCFVRRNNRENSKAYFCSAHLCKLLLAMSIGFSKKILLLLCALVQVASTKVLPSASVVSSFCSVHLCKLLPCPPRKANVPIRFCSVHLCKLLLGIKRMDERHNGFCSVHLCKLLLRRRAGN